MQLIIHLSESARIIHKIDNPSAIELIPVITDQAGAIYPEELVVYSDNGRTYTYELSSIMKLEIIPRD